MRKLIYTFFLLVIIVSCGSIENSEYNAELHAAYQVLERVLDNKEEDIVLKIDTSLGQSSYTYMAQDGELTVKGNSTIALTRGVYDYLKSNQLGMLDWVGPEFSIPKKWPDAPLTKNTSPYPIRHAFNAVTSGYTTPYWDWDRWEKELDWQAMHGFNMLMASVAREAIAERVWKKLGLTQKEIDSFYVGPAHLPWLRMGCIQKVNGPLPPEWHKDQINLQHKILNRMRQLGMEPVVQSFGGFVPKSLKRIFPDITMYETHWNDGFPKDQRPSFIAPDDEVFAKISKLFMEEWQNEFGKAKYFLVDSFNELQLPESEVPVTKLLANYGKKTYDIVKSANPEAIWVIQGWMFSYQRNIWNPKTVEALFSKVPSNEVLILDYANDYNNNWKLMNAFNGKQWVYGFVPNMGGKTAYTGNLSLYATGAAETLQSADHGNLSGFTISGEGLENNTVVYELLTDVAWTENPIDLDLWLKNYCMNRYGGYPAKMKESWDLLRRSAYEKLVPHPQFGWQLGKARIGTVNNDPEFYKAVQSFLDCSNLLSDSPNFCADAIELSALALGLKADEFFNMAAIAYRNGNIKGGDEAGEKGLKLLTNIDKLMASHPLNRLDRWIEMARGRGKTDLLKDYYESNAKYIITVWGPPVNDYSCRVWSGLIGDFYHDRMELVLNALKTNNTIDVVEWEIEWTKKTGVNKVKPFEDPIEAARELIKKNI
ncbi:alpha-N-acetylglucosaminidase [Zhouia amylolytica]|uniref:Alpha-N-acetylglucosaminidase n=1 Tax=Zhouia amylolytica AD3 TaxID=1286632 RepID=W2UQA0_9FLAO|nr:alpha-N-acetylglucosaminidase [Zhouia amylolytica]ETN96178.1 hypothetical protein P278_09440 [Zhouia amylolytica AD3]